MHEFYDSMNLITKYKDSYGMEHTNVGPNIGAKQTEAEALTQTPSVDNEL